MSDRFVSIYFRFLKTDWHSRRNPALRKAAFVLTKRDCGRLVITAANGPAVEQGIYPGMLLADARAAYPALLAAADKEEHEATILNGLARWCIQFTPWVAVDAPDGLILNATGCTHLWQGELQYLHDITQRLAALGYTANVAMAGTIGAAWAASHFCKQHTIIPACGQCDALLSLPPAALRLEPEVVARLHKLGIQQIGNLLVIPRTALRRRFGAHLLLRIEQFAGSVPELREPVQPVTVYQHRLPCVEPISTRGGIEVALQTLLEQLCRQLSKEGKGLRRCTFTCFRVDGRVQSLGVGTNRATAHADHLFGLFSNKLEGLEPALGFEVFLIEAARVEPCLPLQEKLWEGSKGLESTEVVELLDRLADRLGEGRVARFLPAAHHWPERSVKRASSIDDKPSVPWKYRRRPVVLLNRPEPVQVTAPIPDYPPMNFRYKGKLYVIKKADGPERIEQEWWLQQGEHRDYYAVEDAEGGRYWIFRSGHYDSNKLNGWFLHGFFA
jgi:protein ImuB